VIAAGPNKCLNYQTFYGMHLFDGDDVAQTQRTFWITFSLVTGITYILAYIALRSYNPQSHWQWLGRFLP
jgi:hypothetical protein